MEWFEGLWTIQNGIAFLTLTALEIVLGIDNIVFITVLVEKLPASKRSLGRRVGLALAMLMRIALLFAVSWIASLQTELFHLFGHGFTGHSLILIVGGLFLIAKATWEIHDKLEAVSEHISEADVLEGKTKSVGASITSGFWMVMIQIVVLDLIFSIDSVITAVGMADNLVVIIAAVIIAVGVMLIFADVVGRFVSKNPTIKMLALAFLILIGVALVAEGFEVKLPKGYIYSAMGFSLFVELINLKIIKGMLVQRNRRKKAGPQ